jgi:DNA-directed RNA polymerase subunit RPC12/RpoP
MKYSEFCRKFSENKEGKNPCKKIKFNYTLTCPRCGLKVNIYRLRIRIKFVQRKNSFFVFKNTIFEKSRPDFIKRVYANHLFINGTKEISEYQLQRESGVTLKRIWKILKQIFILTILSNKKTITYL